MSLRRRLALLSALAVALTVVLASVLVYTLVRDRLRSDVDNDLRDQATRVTQRFRTGPMPIGGAVGAHVTGSGAGTALPPVAPTAPSGKVKDERAERGEQLELALPPTAVRP